MQRIRFKSTLICVVVAACLTIFTWAVLRYGQEPPQLNRGLKILYAGQPGSDREKDFVGFLKKYFDVVQTGNLQVFKETDTQGFDVTLLDWDWNLLSPKPPCPMVSPSFSRPVVTIGVPGGYMCERWHLKTGYN